VLVLVDGVDVMALSWDEAAEIRQRMNARSEADERWLGQLCAQVNYVSSSMRVPVWVHEWDEFFPEYFSMRHRKVVIFFLLVSRESGLVSSLRMAADWLRGVNVSHVADSVMWESRMGMSGDEVRECIRVFFSLFPDMLERGFGVENGIDEEG